MSEDRSADSSLAAGGPDISISPTTVYYYDELLDEFSHGCPDLEAIRAIPRRLHQVITAARAFRWFRNAHHKELHRLRVHRQYLTDEFRRKRPAEYLSWLHSDCDLPPSVYDDEALELMRSVEELQNEYAEIGAFLVAAAQQLGVDVPSLQAFVCEPIHVSVEDEELNAIEATARARLVDDPVEQCERPREEFTVAQVRTMTGLSNSTLNKYAKLAKVTTPKRGKRNYRYPRAAVIRILETIIAETSENQVRERCRKAHRQLKDNRRIIAE